MDAIPAGLTKISYSVHLYILNFITLYVYIVCNLSWTYAHNMFCFVQNAASFLVAFVNDTIEEMTPATSDLTLATLKGELIDILDSNPFGKSLRLQESSCENLCKLFGYSACELNSIDKDWIA